MAAVCRLEDGVQMPVLTGRNSKRRFRVDSVAKRSRQREFMTVGADRSARHRDVGAVSG